MQAPNGALVSACTLYSIDFNVAYLMCGLQSYLVTHTSSTLQGLFRVFCRLCYSMTPCAYSTAHGRSSTEHLQRDEHNLADRRSRDSEQETSSALSAIQ